MGIGRGSWVSYWLTAGWVDDSSAKEKRSRAGVEETLLAESYIGSSTSAAKLSLVYLDGLRRWGLNVASLNLGDWVSLGWARGGVANVVWEFWAMAESWS